MNEYHYTGGENRKIGVLLRDDRSYSIEAWGNSREGFAPYLVKGTVGVCIGSRYAKLADLRDKAWRLFQVTVRNPRGSFHDA